MKTETIPHLIAALAVGFTIGLGAGYWLDNPVKAYEAFDSSAKCRAYYATRVETDEAATLAAYACNELTPSY